MWFGWSAMLSKPKSHEQEDMYQIPATLKHPLIFVWFLKFFAGRHEIAPPEQSSSSNISGSWKGIPCSVSVLPDFVDFRGRTRFFLENTALSVCSHYGPVTSCQVSERSNDRFQEKLRTDEPKNQWTGVLQKRWNWILDRESSRILGEKLKHIQTIKRREPTNPIWFPVMHNVQQSLISSMLEIKIFLNTIHYVKLDFLQGRNRCVGFKVDFYMKLRVWLLLIQNRLSSYCYFLRNKILIHYFSHCRPILARMPRRFSWSLLLEICKILS